MSCNWFVLDKLHKPNFFYQTDWLGCEICGQDVFPTSIEDMESPPPDVQWFRNEITRHRGSLDICIDCFRRREFLIFYPKVATEELLDDLTDICCISCRKYIYKNSKCFYNEHCAACVCWYCFKKPGFDVHDVFFAVVGLEETDTSLIVCTYDNVVLDISPVEHRIIPKQVQEFVNTNSIKKWADMILKIVNIRPDYTVFGPVKQWVLFGGIYSHPVTRDKYGLIVDCSDSDLNGRIASVCQTRNGVNVDIIYKDIQDFMQAIQTWYKNVRLPKKDRGALRKKLRQQKSQDIEWSDMDMALVCSAFSGYIRWYKKITTW